MEERDIRLACLKLAHEASHSPDEVVRRADAYAAFVLGQPVQTPRQIIDAALEAANVR